MDEWMGERHLGGFSHQPIRAQCLQGFHACSTHQIRHQEATTEASSQCRGGMLEAGPSVWLGQAARKYYKPGTDRACLGIQVKKVTFYKRRQSQRSLQCEMWQTDPNGSQYSSTKHQ